MSGLEAGHIERMMVLECPDCGREAVVPRDDTDPPAAVRARLQCDRCDDGDRHSPEFFDGSGAWVNPVDHLAAPRLASTDSPAQQTDEGIVA